MKTVEELQTEINKILFKEIDNLELKRLLNKNFIEKTLNSSTVSLLFNEEKFVEELNEIELICLADGLYKYFSNNEKLNPKKYFSDISLESYRNYMNIIEVAKKENLGKKYEVFIDGYSKGVWELGWLYGRLEFDLFNEEKKTLTFIFSISQILRMEFAEVIDWSKMPVDTKVLVSKDGEIWFRRYFAKYEDGKVYFFSCGASSYSIDDISNVLSWEYVKLYQK